MTSSSITVREVSEQIGTFMRYVSRENAGVLVVWPELEPCVVRETYAEAFDAAVLMTMRRLAVEHINEPIRIYYKPHDPGAEDPMDRVGSWGWKTV